MNANADPARGAFNPSQMLKVIQLDIQSRD